VPFYKIIFEKNNIENDYNILTNFINLNLWMKIKKNKNDNYSDDFCLDFGINY
jgi:hypothetical protein